MVGQPPAARAAIVEQVIKISQTLISTTSWTGLLFTALCDRHCNEMRITERPGLLYIRPSEPLGSDTTKTYYHLHDCTTIDSKIHRFIASNGFCLKAGYYQELSW